MSTAANPLPLRDQPAERHRFNLEPVAVPRIETKHRRIMTKFPAPGTREIMEGIAKRESVNVLNQMPVIWERAKGHQIFDPWGNAFIDFSSTIFVTNCGHGHPHMVEAITKHAQDLTHAYFYPTRIKLEFLEKLIAAMPAPLEKALLFSTGTEASERAVKIARHFGMQSSPRRKAIIGWEWNYHGFTMGSLMSGGYAHMRDWVGYQDPGMVQLPFPYPWVMERTNLSGAEKFRQDIASLESRGIRPGDIAALFLETFQGWGALFYPDDYVQEARRWSHANDVLMIFDEIQAGYGRTGKFFAYQHYGIEPDLVVCGKGMSGSFPLSAVIGPARIIDLAPTYTSTHGGHPLACAAGLANLEIFERENLVAESERKGPIVQAELERWKARFPHRIGRILGRGLLFAAYITRAGNPERLDTVFCDRIIERALSKGVFNIRTNTGTIKLGPPLNIPDDALVEGLRAIEESIAELDAADRGVNAA